MPGFKKASYFVPNELLIIFRINSAVSMIDDCQSVVDALAEHPLLTQYEPILDPQQLLAHDYPNTIKRASMKIKLSTGISDKNLIELVKELDKVTETFEEGIPGLISVSPNWRMAATEPPTSGLGGPGAYPIANTAAANYQFTFFKKEGEPIWTNEPQCEINVAVMDAFPCRALPQTLGDNPLWPSFRNAFSLAPEDPQTQAELDSLAVTHQDHDYVMNNHGIFVAGIIHSIAPGAKIKGFRVLNDYGIGTVDGILHTLELVLESYTENTNPLLVNMSLTMCFPYDDKKVDWMRGWTDLEDAIAVQKARLKAIAEARINGDPVPEVPNLPQNILDRLITPLSIVRDAIYSRPNTIIIAAAGNEGGNGQTPDALYPAAYENVVGVAALEKWGGGNALPKLTRYSCKADAPPFFGFAVFGGNVSNVQGRPNTFRAGSTSGILGLWLGPLPDGTIPDDGWVRWAGTSFATPIITGAVAMLSCKHSFDLTAALEDLRNTWPDNLNPPDIEIPDRVLVSQG